MLNAGRLQDTGNHLNMVVLDPGGSRWLPTSVASDPSCRVESGQEHIFPLGIPFPPGTGMILQVPQATVNPWTATGL